MCMLIFSSVSLATVEVAMVEFLGGTWWCTRLVSSGCPP